MDMSSNKTDLASFLPHWTYWKSHKKQMAHKNAKMLGCGDAEPSNAKNGCPESINDEDNFISRFENLYNNQLFSDIVLKVGVTSYYAHKIMLMTASEVFEAMLSEDRWQESTKAVVCLTEEDCCVPVFPVFLRYLYCGKFEINTGTVLPVLLLADKYCVKKLCESCVNYMMQHIVESSDTNRTLSWYQYAKMTSNHVLQESCRAFILSNFQIVQKASDWMVVPLNDMIEFLSTSDIVVISEYHIWKEVEQWLLCKHNHGNIVHNLKRVLPLIRFSLMTPGQLAELEESPLYLEYKDIFGDIIWQAYRRHSLLYENIVSSRNPYRNYTCLSQYGLYCELKLDNYATKQTIDSKISIENLKIPANFMPKKLQLQSKQFSFMVDFFPKGFFMPHILYSQYIGRHNEDTTLKIRLCIPSYSRQTTPLPDMKVDITMIIYGMKGKVRYAAYAYTTKHTFSEETPKFEVPSIIPISKLTDSTTNFLVNGNFEAQLFIKIQDLVEK